MNYYVYLGKAKAGLQTGETYKADVQSWMGGAKIVTSRPSKWTREYESLEDLMREWALVEHMNPVTTHVTVTFSLKSGKTMTIQDWTYNGDDKWWDHGDIFEKSVLRLSSPNGSSHLWIPTAEISFMETHVSRGMEEER